MTGPKPLPEPSAEEGLRLYRALCNHVATAPYDFAAAFLPSLLAWVEERHRQVDEHLRQDAAHTAILSFVEDPTAYDPSGLDVAGYLRMSTQGDLRNLLQREARHHRRRVPWKVVEDSPDAGKYLGRDDDASFRLRIAEEQGPNDRAYEIVFAGCNEIERRVLELMHRGEKRTPVFAEVMGIGDRPKEEQRKEVKKMRDRLDKRLDRAKEDT
ncbi:MAG: hypothetical protein HYS12_12700 [Planctomycetes bacterium]|nr:hypothetical protein [Planctomycetota bacterium]